MNKTNSLQRKSRNEWNDVIHIVNFFYILDVKALMEILLIAIIKILTKFGSAQMHTHGHISVPMAY